MMCDGLQILQPVAGRAPLPLADVWLEAMQALPSAPGRRRTMGARMNCRSCDRPMVPQRTRVADVPPGHARYEGRGLCNGCWARHHRHGDLYRFDRIFHPWRDTREDHDFLLQADPSLTPAQIADRLGMTVAALRKALARRD